MPVETAPSGRAAPLRPQERRAAVVEAVLPLVAERGIDVTTRQLADAAGVAEGTLFRAFGDKLSLVGAVAMEGLHRASGPEETRTELAAIDLSLPLADRLAEVIDLGRRRMADVVTWMTVLRSLHERTGSGELTTSDKLLRAQFFQQRQEQRDATVEGLVAVLRPDVDRLRVPLDVAVALVEAAIAGTHGRIDHLLPAPSAEVVAEVLVHGLLDGSRAGPGEQTTGNPHPHRTEPPQGAA